MTPGSSSGVAPALTRARSTARRAASMMSRTVFATLLLTLLCSLGGRPVGAAVTFDIQVRPAEPRVGDAATVEIKTYETDLSAPGYGGRELRLDSFAWGVEGIDPGGTRHPVPLEASGTPENSWIGTIVFDEPGEWTVGLDSRSVSAPYDPRLSARITVNVRPRVAVDSVGLAVVLLLIPIVGLAVWFVRSALTKH